ncbi:MAG TPA: hypothetical protein VIL97_03960 [Thermoanaerobaculia bacterium]
MTRFSPLLGRRGSRMGYIKQAALGLQGNGGGYWPALDETT